MKKYPAYRDSGIKWIGKIPEHWDTVKLKRLTQFLYGDSLSNENRIEGEVPVYGSNGITGYHNKAISNAPCIVIGRKGSFGKINYSEVLCFPIDTTYFIDNTATNNDIRWLYFALQTLNLDSISKDSAVPGLSREDAYDRITLSPPPCEQQSIADYLDKKTALIDSLVEKKKRQIELLKEQRQAVINQAVTKGLDPTVEMKDSGIEWLGEIPKHWEMIKVKYLFNLITQQAPINNDFELLSLYTDIGVKPRKELEARGNKASTTDEYWMVKKGDIIVNKLLAWMGAIGHSDYDGVTSPAYDILRKKTDLNSKFYHYLFRCGLYLTEFKRRSRGIMDMRLRLYFDELGQILVVYPPSSEQDKIVEYINRLNTDTDLTILKAEKQIDLLQEYRTALISEAVTGKIDVRETV